MFDQTLGFWHTPGIIDLIVMPSRHHLSRKGQNARFAVKREEGFAKRRKAKAIRMRKLEAKATAK